MSCTVSTSWVTVEKPRRKPCCLAPIIAFSFRKVEMCLKIMGSKTFAHARSKDIGMFDVGRDRFSVFSMWTIFAYLLPIDWEFRA